MGGASFKLSIVFVLVDEIPQTLKAEVSQGGVVIPPHRFGVEDGPAHIAGGVAELFDRIVRQDFQCIVHRQLRKPLVRGRFPVAAFYLEVSPLHNRRLHPVRPENISCSDDVALGGNVRWGPKESLQVRPELVVQRRKT